MTNERAIILDCLIMIFDEKNYSNSVEKAVLDKYDYLEDNRKAFIKKVTDGTVENVLLLDDIINKYSKLRSDRLKKPILYILRMSIYQLLFMDRVPDHAVINEAVKLTSLKGYGSLKGYVNAVLRNIARNKDSIKTDDEETFPEWIKELFINSYGKDTASAMMKDMNLPHPVIVRYRGDDPLLPKNDSLIKHELAENAYIVPSKKSLKDINGFSEGLYTVQDVSSQIAVESIGIKKGDLVLDVCASPGGKAFYAYDLGAKVIARDISEKKTGRIAENKERLTIPEGDGRFTEEVFDARKKDPSMVRKADVVIADVPCSGLGIIGKKSDIRIRQDKEALDDLIVLQRQIMDTVYDYAKPGGIIMYSTCTVNPGENIRQVEYFLEKYPLKLYPDNKYLSDGTKQFLPGVDKTDGFFMARFIKE